MNKIGIAMTLPEGKLPGYYAQVIKGLADKLRLFDRDKDLLVVETGQEKEAAIAVLDHYKVAYDVFPLLLLPDSTEMTSLFPDYGFVTRLDRKFVFANQVAIFRFEPGEAATPEPDMARLQAEEQLIAVYPQDASGEACLVIDQEWTDLMEGIGRRYGCRVHWL